MKVQVTSAVIPNSPKRQKSTSLCFEWGITFNIQSQDMVHNLIALTPGSSTTFTAYRSSVVGEYESE